MRSLSVLRSFNLNNALDKEFENKTLKEVLKLRPSALQGLSPSADPFFAKLKIHTIEDLGHWKLYKISCALVDLADLEEAGKRSTANVSNLNLAFDKDCWGLSLHELCDKPPHAIRGIAPWVDDELGEYKNIKTLRGVAGWKFPRIAQQICTLAEFEE